MRTGCGCVLRVRARQRPCADRPDILGVPHWAGWCYAAYTHGVGNFARYWVHRQREGKAV